MRLIASHPWDISVLSPGTSHRCTVWTLTSMLRTDDVQWYTQGGTGCIYTRVYIGGHTYQGVPGRLPTYQGVHYPTIPRVYTTLPYPGCTMRRVVPLRPWE